MSTRLHIVVSDELLARVDAARGLVSRSAWLREAVEQTLWREGHDGPAAERPEPYVFEAERQAVRAAVEAGAKSVRVEMGSALPAEQPRDETRWRPGSPEERLLGLRSRSSSQAKRDVAPVPKRGEKK